MINEIIILPQIFKKEDVSVKSYLTNIGLINNTIQSIEGMKPQILKSVRNDEGAYLAWKEYSENKRSQGWFLRELKENEIMVGNLGDNGKIEEELAFDNKEEALAMFITKELISIVSSE